MPDGWGRWGPPFQVSEQTANSFPGLEFAQAGTLWEEGHPKAVTLSGQELLVFAQLCRPMGGLGKKRAEGLAKGWLK